MEVNETCLSCGVQAFSHGWEVSNPHDCSIPVCRGMPLCSSTRAIHVSQMMDRGGGSMQKCHKDTSVSEADGSFHRGLKAEITARFISERRAKTTQKMLNETFILK